MKPVVAALALFLLGISFGARAEIAEASCGGASFQVEVTPVDEIYGNYKLYGTPAGNGMKKRRLFAYDGGFLDAACVADAQGRPLVMIKVNCGGSACAEEFGLIDPRNLRMLLRPSNRNRSNEKAAAAILKMTTRQMPDLEKESPQKFCCKVPVR